MQLLVRIRSLTVTEFDAIGLVEDPTGALPACVSRRVIEEQGAAFQVGAVVLLRHFSVFVSSGRKHVNIAPDAVVRVWPPLNEHHAAHKSTNKWLFA